MERNGHQNEDDRVVKRRDFMKLSGILGLTSILIPACSPDPTEQTTEIAPTDIPTRIPTTMPSPERSMTPSPTPVDEGYEITLDMIKAAEKIADIELTVEERLDVLAGVNQNLDYYRDLRKRNITDDVNPSMIFNPIPPGMSLSTEKKPIRFSRMEVGRPDALDDVAFYSILELAHLIQTRQVTSMELTRMYLNRLKKYNERFKFYVTLTEELAMDQAARMDEEILEGKYRGPLHGIPYGIKDLFSVSGYPTTWGAEPFKDQIIDRNATVFTKLEEAGAVLLAKLATGELATGDQWFGGQTRNAWDPSSGAGGSSAGPGSATAAGCVGFSIGTETNGSMVSPCSVNGVTGLRPTFGRVSRNGAMTISWSFDKVTPMCRTVEDCAVVFDAIYGPDGKDNSIVDLPFNWEPDLDIRNLRIGYHTKFIEHELIDSPTGGWALSFRRAEQEAVRNVVRFFEDRGFDLFPLDFELPHGGESFILVVESAASFDRFFRNRGDQFDQLKYSNWKHHFKRYRFTPAVEYIQATRYRSMIMEAMDQALKDVDVYIEVTYSTVWSTNNTGHPLVVVPCGFYEGRPLSVSFVGKLFQEAELLALAKSFQDATNYHRMHPEL